ncbi:CarD family transcriptional regulator [Candidatus Trichorickettsia mobilis]|jgi:CarD family transcriptional regulator|uniref:CarD family transcriptional regulator n=1 Tax=Candidatus Trichorickettsia mobilis TaxID=1346319 RepID=A0ABZ0UVF8_9RICK|nr:CarD family transcriptional regulator [Candidatus Trichorickettsia mobilis]WPY00894.1 CarD family transcriptional regulator [Candidatus Trichorickettsia mobilis]
MPIAPDFRIGERVVYPSHGVGEIVNIDTQTIGGTAIQVYVISFPQDKMTLKVPVNRAAAAGLRTLVCKNDLGKIYSTLQGKPKQGNRMWSRRAQEYEGKINSGDVVAIAEVVRDLYKNVDSDRSYSERTIYESALNRLAGELAILESINSEDAISKLVEILKEKRIAA